MAKTDKTSSDFMKYPKLASRLGHAAISLLQQIATKKTEPPCSSLGFMLYGDFLRS